MIKDLIIDGHGSGSGIKIYYSRIFFFRIENCTIFNCTYGIELFSTNNGTLYLNNCSFNGVGIYLHCPVSPTQETIGCINNTIIKNTANNNYYGIHLYLFVSGKIINNTANNNNRGIYHEGHPYIISGNTVNNNEYSGISLKGAGSNCEISRNIAIDNRIFGIDIQSFGFNLTGNFMVGSGLALFSQSIERMSRISIDTTNFVNNKPIYYLLNTPNISPQKFQDAGQIFLINCTNILVKDIDVSNSSMGINIYDSNNITVLNAICSNNYYGIHLRNTNNSFILNNILKNNRIRSIYIDGLNNTVEGNYIFSKNFWTNWGLTLDDNYNKIINNEIIGCITGILFRLSSYNLIYGNIVRNNIDYGLFLGGSEHNLFYENFFVENRRPTDGGLATNKWNNTEIGNYWDNYTGIDGNNDGIGDTPHNITLSPLIQDFLPIVDIQAPNITIISPKNNSFYNLDAPNFNVIIKERFLYNMWYTIDGGITNITFTGNGTITQSAWNALPEGNVIIRFYANDSVGNIGFAEVTIRKDVAAPTININSPTPNELYGTSPPSFNVEIYDANLDSMWYTLDNGFKNTTFVANGTVNQSAWDALPNGTVTITFYANDSAGNIGFVEVTIRRDIAPPIIIINNPQDNDVVGATAPNFDISIDELNLDKTWYSLNGGNNITFTGLTGTINQTLWDTLPEGNIIIRFYANDTLGRIGYQEVIVKKDVTAPTITIQSPISDAVFGINAPDFVIKINELYLDTMWYTIDGGITNITFTGNGTISQSAWNALPEGIITLKFYANDTLGRIGSQEVTVEKDVTAPIITIQSPIGDEVFGINAPDFVVEIVELYLDSMWYTIDGGITNITFTENGTISQSDWDTSLEGNVIVRFYANDSVGNVNFQEVTVKKDVSDPTITIHSPIRNEVFGVIAPDFMVEIVEFYLDTMWYTIDSGVTNITFTENGTISQSVWNAALEGNIVIRFYANDTLGRIGFQELTVKKDVTTPIIFINNPQNDDLVGATAPNFNIDVIEPNLETMWYTIDSGITNITFTENGTISQSAWNAALEGNVVIKFYANDTFGRIGFQEVTVKKDVTAPTISIHSPIGDEVFGIDAPDYVVEINELYLDTMWYTIDGGITNITFTENGTISQSAWDALPEGNVIIRFYANDSLGRIGTQEVTVKKDVTAPTISIHSPFGDEVFGIDAPDYVVEINELYLDTMWYTIDGGITNITFTENGTISQSAWDALPEGNVIIRFYANDSLGRIGTQEVTIKKDVTAPIITINNPQNNNLFGATAPNFNITIDEPNLDTIWYSLNGGTNLTFTGLSGTINQTLWDALPEGNVFIKFYANDTLGRIGFQEVAVTKTIPQSPPPGIPGFSTLFLVGIISVMVVIIIKKDLILNER